MYYELPLRIRLVIDLLKELIQERFEKVVYLDLGIGDGVYTIKIAKEINASETYGVDYPVKVVQGSAHEILKCFELDLSRDKIPLPDNSVDVVTALEVIEHLVNPDNMLKEVYRILRPHGYFVLTTPNLGYWVNRLLLLLGYQPYDVEPSTEYYAGVPKKLWQPAGHVRAYTLRAISELLKYHGFNIVKIKGIPSEYRNPVFKMIDQLIAIKPSLARRLLIVSKPVK